MESWRGRKIAGFGERPPETRGVEGDSAKTGLRVHLQVLLRIILASRFVLLDSLCVPSVGQRKCSQW